MPALLIEDSSPLMPVEEEDSEDYEYSLSSDDTDTSDDQGDDEYVNDGAIGNSLRYIDSTTIRLPSGKTISHRPDAGFRKSKSRSHKSLTTTSASASRTQKKLRGNCAMISSSSTPSQKVSRTSAASSDHDHESTSSDSDATTPTPNSSALLSTNTQSSALNNRVRAISHKTLRASDMQMMASLPATTQRALMATQQRSVSRSSRADHKFRGKMGAFGNIKMTERFIIDVPFGNRHKCRFPV
ncbi:hypothetical protein PFICI_07706 [Pestalotiopsis fici W106-1]|uniref:Uncharacterized protein n=1 Tax=Pestalotiopsis fici (strain W106-1 / CGMCC3.15140) TaxID=1229662 RepID=W3X456_PESFW|nr:uncharacterized protein PFICI_07706 [Pestalotiopsis fici W106-1]ETS80177.1 hypothetical protein PFICI_07706 [Pestalotiopsis fici W106-1]